MISAGSKLYQTDPFVKKMSTCKEFFDLIQNAQFYYTFKKIDTASL